MQLLESGEMYLETIYILSKKLKSVHSIDVSEYMGYSKPSVSRAVNLLKNGGLIVMENDGRLILTNEGLKTAQRIYERHIVLTNALVALGVDAETAAEDACKIEHDISDATFLALKKHILERGSKSPRS